MGQQFCSRGIAFSDSIFIGIRFAAEHLKQSYNASDGALEKVIDMFRDSFV